MFPDMHGYVINKSERSEFKSLAVVRHLSIRNFRGIKRLDWAPRLGINALIGPGDMGKTSIIEAIEMALTPGAPNVSDTDFYGLDVSKNICIEVTVGDLSDLLLDLEANLPLRGFDATAGTVHPEPSGRLEPVLTVRLSANGDLDVRRQLVRPVPDGEEQADLPRLVRGALVPLRLRTMADHYLSLGERSPATRIAEEALATKPALAAAFRAARQAFASNWMGSLAPVVQALDQIARDVGVPRAIEAQAQLDLRTSRWGDARIALHDKHGLPLRTMGTGSCRLLGAGLQARAAGERSITLIDELEHGLEPYRIARLLHHLGSKASEARQQVFLTTHSPVVLRELSAAQIRVVRRDPVTGEVRVRNADTEPEGQALLRACPEAFLSPSVLVCEGKTEQGLVRGLDLHRGESGGPTMAFLGVTTCDGHGYPSAVQRARALQALGYRVAVLRDDDLPQDPAEAEFLKGGGRVFHWEKGRKTETQRIHTAKAAVAEDRGCAAVTASG
ncbi:MAG: AAA family ATPase [Acetobacteraceae bacterium]|nr:AAA family ATPase [Acetobacteraceae bacterium]